ncbi:MAG: hypothetical protein JRS35_23215, partial [Deltaproteobacteria bacterium]|nr:hypothetical protein [Deltaproteobacteria bacterium]
MNDGLPAGREFVRRAVALAFALTLPGVGIILASLYVLLELTSEQWSWFLGLTAAYGVLISPLQSAWQRRFLAPVVEYLDRRRSGELEEEQRRRAFASVMRYPAFSALMGSAGWLAPVLVIAVVMSLRWSDWGLFESAVLLLTGVGGGFVAGAFLLYLAKTLAAPVREALAQEIEDPGERAALVRKMPVRRKLLVCVTGVSIVPVFFAIMLFQAKTTRSLEDFAIRWQHDVLDTLAARSETAGPDEAVGAVIAQVGALAESIEISSLDLALEGSGAGVLEDHVLAGLRRELTAGAERGDSVGQNSATVFAWRRLGADRILLASMPETALHADTSSIWTIFVVLLVASAGIAFALAYLLAGDVSRATEWLRSEAERLASG